jgi:HD-GYP domain-containing protein (c-di-GMP phosphodiesterase class II)
MSARGAVAGDVVSKNVRKHGLSFLTDLYTALKTSRIYGFDHPTVVKSAQAFVDSMRLFSGRAGDAILEVKDDYVFLSDVRIRPDAGGFEIFHFLVSAFHRLGIGRVHFLPELTLKDVRSFVDAFNALSEPSDALEQLEQLEQQLAAAGVQTIALEPPAPTVAAPPERRRRNVAVEAYYRTVTVLRDVHESLQAGRSISIAKAKKAMHAIVEVVQENETEILALVGIKRLGRYEVTHPTNTAILAVAVGSRLGLPRKALAELGMAALFLDLGMLSVDDSALEARRALTPAEREQMERHPVEAAKAFLQGERMVDVTVRCLRTSFEHHRRYDTTGYPRVEAGKRNSLFTEIVSICDCYDAMTSPRAYRLEPIPPPEALQLMLEEAGSKFDPRLVKVFINTVGIYPLGSLVLLSTGEMGTVYRPNLAVELMARPKVKLFANADGSYANDVVDLAEQGADGAYLRSVVRTLQPEEVDMGTGELLAVL